MKLYSRVILSLKKSARSRGIYRANFNIVKKRMKGNDLHAQGNFY